MYIKQLQILNIRGFENAELEFSKGINLIIGANNSGKSTILKCIFELQKDNIEIRPEDVRKSYETGKTHILLDDIKEKDKKLFNDKGVSPEFVINNKLDIYYSIEVKGGNAFSRDHLMLDPSKAVIAKNLSDIQIIAVSGQPVDQTRFNKFSSMQDQNNFIYPFLATRNTDPPAQDDRKNEALLIDHTLKNLPSKVKQLSHDSFPFSKDFKKYRDEILGFSIGELAGKNNQTTLGIFVNSTEKIYLDSMGEGVSNIVGLLATLFNEKGKLYLIEELENDLHPEVLKKLLNLIIEKSDNNQFIITTHSNIVLKYLASEPDAKVFFTEWKMIEKNDYTLPTTKVTEVVNSPEERYKILEKLGYDFFDFDLYKSYILFEESSAEQIVKEFLIPEFVNGLQNKIKTIAVSGVNDIAPRFHDFLKLFVFIHNTPIYANKAWVIVDGDPPGKDVIKNLRSKFHTWPKEHFLTLDESDFENYYPEKFRNEIEEINSESDKQKRRTLKGNLTKSVIDWTRNNKIEAKTAFAISAKEVIDILSDINRKLDL